MISAVEKSKLIRERMKALGSGLSFEEVSNHLAEDGLTISTAGYYSARKALWPDLKGQRFKSNGHAPKRRPTGMASPKPKAVEVESLDGLAETITMIRQLAERCGGLGNLKQIIGELEAIAGMG